MPGLMADRKRYREDQMRASDEVVDIVEARRYLRTRAETGDTELRFSMSKREIKVSADHDIRLLDVLVYACVDGYTRVRLTITDNTARQLVCCKGSYMRDANTDVVPVKVVKENGARGIELQKGHTYNINVSIEYGWITRYLGEIPSSGNYELVTEKGVEIDFSHDHSNMLYMAQHRSNEIVAGLRFIIM